MAGCRRSRREKRIGLTNRCNSLRHQEDQRFGERWLARDGLRILFLSYVAHKVSLKVLHLRSQKGLPLQNRRRSKGSAGEYDQTRGVYCLSSLCSDMMELIRSVFDANRTGVPAIRCEHVMRTIREKTYSKMTLTTRRSVKMWRLRLDSSSKL
jgi:hypothetical protein